MATKFRIDERWLQDLRDEYLLRKSEGATREQLGDFVKEKAAEVGKSHKTLYARMDMKVRTITKKDSAKTALKWQEIDLHARHVFDLATSKTRDGAKIDWNMTFESLQERGMIPAHIKMHEIYKSITDRQNLPTRSQAVLKQTQRSAPLDLVHIDYSVSRYFKYDPRDHSLNLVPPGEGYYKDAGKRDRLWFACIIDQYSRVMFAQYVLTKGESPEMTQLFMYAAFSEKDRVVNQNTGECLTEELFQGMPENIYWDRGPGHKTLTVKGLEELNIGVICGNNKFDGFGKKTARSNKGAHGMIERMIGEIKRRFEGKISLENKKGWKSSLDDLNERLRSWCREMNMSRHPVITDMNRWDLFSTQLEGMRFPPDNFMSYFAGVYERKVVNRMIDFQGEKYVAPDIARNNSTIQIQEDGGGIYALIGGRRYLLDRQSEWHKEHSRATVMQDDDLLSDRELRLRLDDEIKSQSSGELWLASMKRTHEDDLAAFYEKERSVEEIRIFAAQLVRERSVRMANIIEMPPPDELEQ